MRVGIVGAGWVTQYHLPAWLRLSEIQVAAICDPDAEALERRANEYAVPQRFSSVEEMLDRAELDALDIASPRHLHAEHVRAGVARGLPMLCQKPLGVDLAEAEALVRDIDARVPFMVHENWRFRPYYRELKRWLDEGVLGEIQAIRLEFHSSGMILGADGMRPALVRQPFFRRERRLLVMEVLIHHLDTLRFLFGEFDLLHAQLARSNNEILGEDSATLDLSRRADAVPLTVSGNLAVQGAPPVPTDQLWIKGAQGEIHLDGATLRLAGPKPRKMAFDPGQSYQQAYDSAIAHFAHQLSTGAPFETSAPDNLQTLRLVEAAYRISGFQPASFS
jgi:predicted dehydrogenase